MIAQDIDVFLREKRDYVQGTQIISRIAELLQEEDWVLQQAEFRQLSTKMLRTSEIIQNEADDSVARIRFANSLTGETKTFGVYETGRPAARSSQVMSIEVEPSTLPATHSENKETVWNFRNANTFEDLLNSIVQAIKTEHKILWPQSSNIWLTGFRHFELPVSGVTSGEGSIELTLWRKLFGDTNIQTFWQVRAPEIKLAGMVNFAFRK